MGENDIERGVTHTHLLFHLQQPNVVWKKSPVLDGCSLAEKCMEKRKKRYTISHVWLKALLYFKRWRWAFLRMCINLAYHCTKSINNIKLMASHNGDIFSTICDSKSDVGGKKYLLIISMGAEKIEYIRCCMRPIFILSIWASCDEPWQLGIHTLNVLLQINKLLIFSF